MLVGAFAISGSHGTGGNFRPECGGIFSYTCGAPLRIGMRQNRLDTPSIAYYQGKMACESRVRLRNTRKKINHAHFRTEAEGNSADYVCQVYDTRSDTPRPKP